MCELHRWNRRVVNPAESLKAPAAMGTDDVPVVSVIWTGPWCGQGTSRVSTPKRYVPASTSACASMVSVTILSPFAPYGSRFQRVLPPARTLCGAAGRR